MKMKKMLWSASAIVALVLAPSYQVTANEVNIQPAIPPLTKQSKAYTIPNLSTKYGTGNATLNYGFKEDDGKTVLVENPGDEVAVKFVAHYNDETPQSAAISNTTASYTAKNFTGSFINLSSTNPSKRASAGAIYNAGSNVTIGTVNGDFVGNNIGPSETTKTGNYYGGAIYNLSNGKINTINGSFIGNNIINNLYPDYKVSVYGGAIYNYTAGKVGTINGDFIGNNISTISGLAQGGAIYNSGYDSVFTALNSNFIGNSAETTAATRSSVDVLQSSAVGGAIFNTSSGWIKKITGDFIGNHTYSKNFNAYGGAIYNGSSANIDNIIGNFVNNYAKTDSTDETSSATYISAYGGAIHNVGTISNIEGDFIGNKTFSDTTNSTGGAIYTTGSIHNIKGNFTNNASISTTTRHKYNMVYGNGAAMFIEQNAIIGNVEGDFTGNYTYTTEGYGQGGAIFTRGLLKRISGNFIGNHLDTGLTPAYSVNGGAIANERVANIYDSTFKDNYLLTYMQPEYASVFSASGGAVYAGGTATNLIAEKKDVLFEGNYIMVDGVKKSSGLYVYSTVNLNAGDHDIIFNDSITGGGETSKININQTGTWDMEKDKFTSTGNNLPTTAPTTGKIVLNDDMTGFYGIINQYGGTLKIGEKGTFFGSLTKYYDDGVTIWRKYDYQYNTFDGSTLDTANKKMDTVNVNIDGNLNLVIDTDFAAEEGKAKGDVLNIKSSNNGKVTVNDVVLNNEMKEGTDNFSHTFLTGATTGVDTELLSTLKKLYGQTYAYNVSVNGGVLDFKRSSRIGGLSDVLADADDRTFIIDNDEKIIEWGADTENNLQGNALVIKGQNNAVIGQNNEGINVSGGQTLEVHNVGNTDEDGAIVKGWQGFSSADGGAINNANGTVIVKDSHFTQNVAANNGGAIYNNGGVVNIKAENSHVIFEGNTSSVGSNALHSDGGNININADGSNQVVFNDSITSDINASLNINASKADNASSAFDNASGGVVVLNNDMSGYTGDVNLYHGTLKIGADGTFFENAKNFNVYGCALDLSNAIIQHTNLGNVNIADKLNIIADADLAAGTMDTISASNTLTEAGKINVSKINLLSEAATTQVTINFADASVKDAVSYDGGDVSYSPIYKYNVAYDADNGNFTFSQTDSFNPVVLAAPIAAQVGGYLNQLNTYDQVFNNVDMYMTIEPEVTTMTRTALVNGKKAKVKKDIIKSHSPKGVWFKPIAVFEDVDLNNGPKVDNKAYGSLFGINTDITEYTNGFKGVLSAYAGYLGSQQEYEGNKITQNGGTIGVAGTYYKGGFYTALTANIGATVADNETMYGKEDFTMLNAGIASKTGINVPVGIFNIQPNVQLSYTFINAFDYTNNAGVRVTSDPLNAVQVVPGLKFIANLSKGWQAYLNGAYTWNLLDDTKFSADNVALPEMRVDSYLSYGIGIQKTMVNRFSGYAQVMMSAGGREGIDAKVGLSFAI